MPKRNNYESDGGFIEDAPKSKKRKSAGNELKQKDGKTTVSTEMHKDEEGNEYWEISRTRRVQVSTFKGATMIGIREFYEKDDKWLPGKKGISLSTDQFAAVLDVLPQIETVLKDKGIDIPRPRYGEAGAPDGEAGSDAEDEEEGEEEDEEAEAAASKYRRESNTTANAKSKSAGKSRLDKFKMKANYEATDDEED